MQKQNDMLMFLYQSKKNQLKQTSSALQYKTPAAKERNKLLFQLHERINDKEQWH